MTWAVTGGVLTGVLVFGTLAASERQGGGRDGRPIEAPARPLAWSPVPLDFRSDPPRVENFRVRLLGRPSPQTKAVLLVSFAQDGGLRGCVDPGIDERTVELNDAGQGGDERAGDGIFSGAFTYDAPPSRTTVACGSRPDPAGRQLADAPAHERSRPDRAVTD
jgi:hypothetical protein